MIELKDELKNRVCVCEFNNRYMFYDQNTGRVYLADNEKKIGDVLSTIESTPETESVFMKSADNSFKINLSTICNLHCDYCFRDKDSHVSTDVQKAKQIIDFILDDYAPDLSFYSFAFNMTSESLFELEKLKEIKKYLDERLSIKFTVYDIHSVKQGKDMLSYFGTELVPRVDDFDSVDEILNKLNSFLGMKNLIDYFLIPDGMKIPAWESNQLKNVNKLSKKELILLNRRLIEFLFPETFRHKPNYVFYICTNGTIYSEEASKFFKEIELSKICISLDGPASVHDKHRYFYNGNASHSMILKNVKKFMADGFEIDVAAVITRDCLKPLKLVSYFQSLGVASVTMNIVRAGFGASLDLNDADLLLEGYKELFSKVYLDVVRGDYSLVDLLKNDVCFTAPKHILGKTRLLKRCKWNEDIIFDSKGDIYPCDYVIGRKEFLRGSVGSTKLKEPGNGKLFVDEREGCGNCWCKYMCGGTCFYNSLVKTGDLAVPDSVECKINKGVRELGLKLIHKLILAGVNLFEFGKHLGFDYDERLVFDKRFVLNDCIRFNFKGTLTRFEREVSKMFLFMEKNNMHYKKEFFACVNDVYKSDGNDVLDVSIYMETREKIPFSAAESSDYECLDSFDFGRCIYSETESEDAKIEETKQILLDTVKRYRIPVNSHFIYKGTLEGFLGYEKSRFGVMMTLPENVY